MTNVSSWFFGTRWISLIFSVGLIHVSQGYSVIVSYVRCGGMSTERCMANFLLSMSVKEFLQEAQLLLGDRATRKHAKDCRNGRGNDNLGWNDLQTYFKVIKNGTNRKLVYDFLLVVYSNFCRITHLFEKFDVKQPNDLEICPRSLTVVSPESCHVAMYAK